MAEHDAVVVGSGGPRAAPGVVRAALGSGTVPVASYLPLYEELVRDGEGDARTVTLRGVGRRWAGVALVPTN